MITGQKGFRYIPVPTGNSDLVYEVFSPNPVYPCTYRELFAQMIVLTDYRGISLYLQGTRFKEGTVKDYIRYIPVPTGNSFKCR